MAKRLFSLVTTATTCGCAGVYLGYTCRDANDRLLPLLRADAASAPSAPVPSFGSSGLVPSSGQLLGGSRVSEIMKFGYPGYDNLKTFEDFVLSYDRRNRVAHWVFEHLTPERMTYHPEVDRSKCNFREDTSIPDFFRSGNADYKHSGFDRGHMAAAGNHRKSQNAVNQTFFLSNMAPQVGKGFNRDKWNELEKYVRKLARKNPNVYVCTGPLYLPRSEGGNLFVKYQVIGKSHVSVPTHFFKVLLVEVAKDQYVVESYVLPNQPIPDPVPLTSFYTPVESIERAAGFFIFEKLPRNLIHQINGQKV